MQTLRDLRLDKAMKLEDLSDKTELNIGYLSCIERGLVKAPTWTLKKIAEALEKDFDFIRLIHDQQIAENAKTPD